MDIKDVENLAKLARLDLTEEEKKQALIDMDGILKYVKQINEVEVPTSKGVAVIAPTNIDIHNIWREDKEEKRDFSRDLILEQFPDSQGDFLKVKKIL